MLLRNKLPCRSLLIYPSRLSSSFSLASDEDCGPPYGNRHDQTVYVRISKECFYERAAIILCSFSIRHPLQFNGSGTGREDWVWVVLLNKITLTLAIFAGSCKYPRFEERHQTIRVLTVRLKLGLRF